MPLKDIAATLSVSDTQIRKWKNIDKWADKLNSNVTNDKGNITNKPNSNVTIKKAGAPIGNKNALGHGAPRGNKNALGNNGGAPLHNTNAVVTGEYQTIWLDMIDEKEKALIHSIDTDPLAQLNEDIRLLTIRERRMLMHLNTLHEQSSLLETKKEYAIVKKPVIIDSYNELTGKTQKVKTYRKEKELVSYEENKKLLIDKILRVEEALTRVQTAKTKAIESKHRIAIDNAQNTTISSEKVIIVDDWGDDNA